MSTQCVEQSIETAATASGDEVLPRGYRRLAALAGLFLAELLALSLRFDARSIEDGLGAASGAIGTGSGPAEAGAGWLPWLFGHSSAAMVLGMCAAAAIVLFGGRELREGLGRAAGSAAGRRSWPMLAVHLAALAAFWMLTRALAEGGVGASAWGRVGIVAWAISGLAVVISLAAAAFPPRSRRPLARQVWRAAAVGAAVGLAATAAGLLARQVLWMRLGRWTMEAVRGMLALTTTSLTYRPAEFVVGTESFEVNIAPQCSGYEGIGLVWAFLIAYLFLGRRQLRFPRAWLLLPVGTVAIWVANVLRIVALILIGSWVSPEIAVGGFHSQAGWLGFIAVSLGLILLAQNSRFFRRDDGVAVEAASGPSREAVYLAPLLSIVAAAMIGGAFSTGGLDRFYPARLAAVAVPLWLYRRQYAAMRWTCSWQAPAIGLLVFTLWIARWPQDPGGSSARSMMTLGTSGAWTFTWLAARVIGSALTVPLAEELAFRGFLTRRLIAADFESIAPGRFTWMSFLVSSIAFGVLHDRWIEGSLAGMLYALAYYRRGSLGDAVAAHATTNGLLCIDALTTGDWSLFS
jgi:exosortase E/protease (VPEID-CTERM system)